MNASMNFRRRSAGGRPARPSGGGGADDEVTRPIPAQPAATSFDTPRRADALERQPVLVQAARVAVFGAFGLWTRVARKVASQFGWFPRVEPYAGYGTGAYSRLICRTVLAPANRASGVVMRGIRTAMMVPAPGVRVRISIDGVPLTTVQVGVSEIYDAVDPARDQGSEFAVSDSSGYLDLVAERTLAPGPHHVSYEVARRKPCSAKLYTIDRSARVGIISDIDDTVLVTQAPLLMRAAINLLFRDPRSRRSVPGMAVFYNRLRELLPDAPFFYLSTSPWNIEASLRHFLESYGFPDGPLLLRDLDPRPKTFVPTGVKHKLEFAEQLMADFPDMRFILLGDDGQKDPSTYATIARRYPGRVIAIGLRQLPRHESVLTRGVVRPAEIMPECPAPVFYGVTGVNLMNTMMPYLKRALVK